ncbi:glycosyltransferase family 39 protein [Dyadobacter chenwenxiniae]|uniref:Glycosyltransferase family 39 protein n=1 Tax=Dyadobacter chenwenxiniae TaxID=2906456 RepID=A0A9X1PG82_9BACT|nr:glycosyltransferase family 39 protein [Dyadobacter chenwenxiniae]MCF0060787.1 glycosyltransferase family 39 protein [Dyadobacter chenwenxiniae]UON80619.1 glycosyltransferase family 39 protein [Dyadobacter chenwenxiniae]
MSSIRTNESLKTWLIVAVILIAGIALRLHNLDRYSIFFDERSTMVISQGVVLEGANQKEVFSTLKVTNSNFWETPQFSLRPPRVLRSFTYNENYYPRAFTPAEFWAPKTIDDYYEANNRSDIGNSPFYYLLLHFWMEVFGISDFSARSLSVFFSVLIIGLTFLFGRRFFSVNTGLIASAIVAIEPFFIGYSQQARSYSLMFFLTLLATYFFLQIIESEANKRQNTRLYIGYIVTAGLSILSHFLSIAVLLGHALYALLFLRTIKGWVKMAFSAVLALSGVAWWMIYGGGTYTLYTLNYQAALYKRMAETRPYDNPFGTILPATIGNVFTKALPLFSDLVIFTNGLTDALAGKKNVFVSLFIGVLLIIWYRFSNRMKLNVGLKAAVPFILALSGAAFYSNHKVQFVILSVSVFALSFIPDVHRQADSVQKKRLWMIYIMALFPTSFLIIMSFKNGHTYGLMQRYSGFAFPYMIILLSLLLQYYNSIKVEFRTLIFIGLACQLYFVSLRLGEFYEDRSPKYGYFSTPRAPNPYYEAAQKIKKLYQKGDTILYPASRYEILSEMDRTFLPYSIQDAQVTNLYLPKDAQYVQVMDTTQTTHILLKKAGNKEPVVIKKLKGLRYGLE